MSAEDKNRKINGILDAAERVFSRYGFRQANMELLAQEAGLSRQGLYLFFKSKNAVFAAVVERIQRETVDNALHAAEQARARGAGAANIVVAQIHARASSFLVRLKDSPYVAELNEESGRQCPEIVEEYSRKFVAGVADTIAAEHKRGRLGLPEGVTPKKAAQLIVASARGLKMANPPPTPAEFKRDLGIVVSLLINEQ
jgi:AcrR family transcriptional regulator